MLARIAVGATLIVLVAPSFGQSNSKDREFPRVVARVEFHNQSGAIPSTTFFIPDHDGLFRVSGYADVPVQAECNGQDAFFAGVSYTDDQRQLGQIFMIFDLTSAFGPQGSLILESKAGMPINLLVTNDVPCQDITQAGQYNLYVVLEELSPVNRDH